MTGEDRIVENLRRARPWETCDSYLGTPRLIRTGYGSATTMEVSPLPDGTYCWDVSPPPMSVMALHKPRARSGIADSLDAARIAADAAAVELGWVLPGGAR